MSNSTPPRLATWLLLRLTDNDAEALIGDLFEEYPHRHAGWYWRQVGHCLMSSGRASLRRRRFALSLGGTLILWLGILNAVAYGNRRVDIIVHGDPLVGLHTDATASMWMTRRDRALVEAFLMSADPAARRHRHKVDNSVSALVQHAHVWKAHDAG
jgi:hypothetical protein